MGIEEQHRRRIYIQLGGHLGEEHVERYPQVENATDRHVNRMQGAEPLHLPHGLLVQACALDGVAGDFGEGRQQSVACRKRRTRSGFWAIKSSVVKMVSP